MSLRILVTHTDRAAAELWRAELRTHLPGATVDLWPCASDTPAASDAPADYAIGWMPPADFFARNPSLRAFFSAGAGVDYLLRHPGLPAALPIIRLEDAGMVRQMAEYCCHEVFRLRGRFGDYERQQAAARWHELTPRSAGSMRIGIFGLGVLGSEVARTLQRFGYPVAGFTRRPSGLKDIENFYGASRWPDFLARCDVLILMAPLTADTEKIIDAHALAMLPPGAWLINVARGGLVNEADLLAALDSNRLAGATLDVFASEPLPAGHRFWRHPNVRVTPHVSAITLVAEGARQVAGKIDRLARHLAVSGLVDRQHGY